MFGMPSKEDIQATKGQKFAKEKEIVNLISNVPEIGTFDTLFPGGGPSGPGSIEETNEI